MRGSDLELRERLLNIPFSRSSFTPILLGIAGIAAGWAILAFPPFKVMAVGLGVLFMMLAAWKIDLALFITVFFMVIVQEAESTTGTFFALLEKLNRPGIPSLLEVLFAVIAAAFVIRYFIMRDGRYSLLGMKIPLTIFFVLLFMSLGIGIHEGFHRDIIKEDFKRFVFPVLFFVVAVNILDSRKKIERLLLMIFLVMLPKTCLAIFYYIKGLGFPYGDDRVVFLESGDQTLLVMIIVAGIGLLAEQRGLLRQAALMGLGIVPMLFALIFSYRRNALWGAILSLLLLFILSQREKKRRLIKIFALAAVAGFTLIAFLPATGLDPTGTFLKKRLVSVVDKNESSNVAHMNEWKVTLDDIMGKPFFGLGIGSVHSSIPDFENINVHTVHNALLMLWMKLGVFALILFLWCMYRYCRMGFREALSGRDPLLIGLFASIALWAIAINVGPSWFYYRESCLIALSMAIVIRLRGGNDEYVFREIEEGKI